MIGCLVHYHGIFYHTSGSTQAAWSHGDNIEEFEWYQTYEECQENRQYATVITEFMAMLLPAFLGGFQRHSGLDRPASGNKA